MAKINLTQSDLDIIAEILEPGKKAQDLKTLHLAFGESYVEFLERDESSTKARSSNTPIFIERFQLERSN